MKTKFFIKDIITDKYYGVECAANPKGYLINAKDEGSPSENDFSFWTDDKNKAFDFGSKNLAENELRFNDFSDYDAKIIKNVYVICNETGNTIYLEEI